MITKDTCARLGLLALAALSLAACETGPQVRSVTEPGANLSAYRTYSFVAQPGTNRGGNTTPLTTFFETAIAREMTARGYQQVDANGDLMVNFNAHVSEKADIQSTPGPAYGTHGMAQTSRSSSTEGTFTIRRPRLVGSELSETVPRYLPKKWLRIQVRACSTGSSSTFILPSHCG